MKASLVSISFVFADLSECLLKSNRSLTPAREILSDDGRMTSLNPDPITSEDCPHSLSHDSPSDSAEIRAEASVMNCCTVLGIQHQTYKKMVRFVTEVRP